jgi:hypothetical protein
MILPSWPTSSALYYWRYNLSNVAYVYTLKYFTMKSGNNFENLLAKSGNFALLILKN